MKNISTSIYLYLILNPSPLFDVAEKRKLKKEVKNKLLPKLKRAHKATAFGDIILMWQQEIFCVVVRKFRESCVTFQIYFSLYLRPSWRGVKDVLVSYCIRIPEFLFLLRSYEAFERGTEYNIDNKTKHQRLENKR